MALFLGTELVANSATVPYNWSGTKAEYDAIATKNPDWVYYITDDNDTTLTLLQTIYPVGSIYITTNSTCPLSALFGTWTLVGADRVLQGAGTRGAVGTTVNESLPNITGSTEGVPAQTVTTGISWGDGSFGNTITATTLTCNSGGSSQPIVNITFDASLSSSTYQNNAPVQQDAYLVNIFRRTA